MSEPREIYDPEGLVGRVDGSGSRFYQFDPQGSVSHTLDASGNLIDSRAYDAYGRELAVKNASGATVVAGDPFGFDAKWGYYLDREVGWYHTDNRTYDPLTARWLERDPIGLAGGVNPYSYCGANPVGNADPSGLYIVPLGSPKEIAAINEALNDLRSAPKGSPIWRMMQDYDHSSEPIYIDPLPDSVNPWVAKTNNNLNPLDDRDQGTPTVHYSPRNGYDLRRKGKGGSTIHFTPETTLAHELGHRDPKNPKRLKRDDPGGKGGVRGAPVGPNDNVGQIENPYRDWKGFPRRYYY